jgi:DNA invertase Pin-like site-specific DNA recombinase
MTSDANAERDIDHIQALHALVAEGIIPAAERGASDGEEVRRLQEEGLRPVDIAKRLGIGRASVYRHLPKYAEPIQEASGD